MRSVKDEAGAPGGWGAGRWGWWGWVVAGRGGGRGGCGALAAGAGGWRGAWGAAGVTVGAECADTCGVSAGWAKAAGRVGVGICGVACCGAAGVCGVWAACALAWEALIALSSMMERWSRRSAICRERECTARSSGTLRSRLHSGQCRCPWPIRL